MTKKEIGQVLRDGGTVRGSFLFIRFLKNQKKHARFAFIVPAKYVPFAVDRNKIKRILSEEVARTLSLLRQDLNIVVIVSKKVSREKFRDLVGELKELLFKISPSIFV